jgi:siroheme synthase
MVAWERYLKGKRAVSLANEAVSVRETDANLLTKVGANMKGKVYLMGAGPGDRDHLTVRAVQLLRSAEAVFHDDFVSAEVLELVPASSYVRNVGKSNGQEGLSQEKVESLLILTARDGRQVVRLKGRDPLLFGQFKGEMEALSQAGIEFEIVQMVGSAMEAAAAAGLS